MDTGEGRFERLPAELELDALMQAMKKLEASHPEHGGWFREGEIIELRGSRFRVQNIRPTRITLKLLPRKDGSATP